jgi:predicted enzyme related to lactoylglutathione lyase
MQPIPTGSFVWHDLVTPRAQDAVAFYSEVARWNARPWEHDETDYTLFALDDEPLGGAGTPRVSHDAAPRWVPYVYVYDVDACVRQVAKLGGQVHRGPVEVPNVGCWALIADPQGAEMGMFEPCALPSSGDGAARAGEFSWHELNTTDYRAAFEFYKALFQWERIAEHDMGASGRYFMFGQRGRTYGGMFNGTSSGQRPSWLSYLRVDDVSAAAQVAERLGGKVKRGPMEVPGGDWIAQCEDPVGAPFALHTPRM